MPCGGCQKRKKNFKIEVNKKSVKEMEINRKSKEYYDPNNDPNYNLTKMSDDTLTPKQLRIKKRIIKLERTAKKQAKIDIENLEQK